MKTPIVLFQICMKVVSCFQLMQPFFHATAVTKNYSKDPQKIGTNHGTDITCRTILSAYYDYLFQYEVGITVFYIIFIWKVTCH